MAFVKIDGQKFDFSNGVKKLGTNYLNHKCPVAYRRLRSDEAIFDAPTKPKIKLTLPEPVMAHQMPYGQKFGARRGEERRNLLCPPPPTQQVWLAKVFIFWSRQAIVFKKFFVTSFSFSPAAGFLSSFFSIFVGRKKYEKVCVLIGLYIVYSSLLSTS